MLLIFAVLLNITIGLWAYRYGPVGSESIVSVATWIHLTAWTVLKLPPQERYEVVCALILATLGELFLTEVWGLYHYQSGFMPLFVPPGHVLLFLAGKQITASLPSWTTKAVALSTLVFMVPRWLSGDDLISFVGYLIFLLCLMESRGTQLYGVMFLLALSLEILGTSLGAWTWVSEIPGWGLSSANPPLAAGVLYCLLDLFVLRLTRLKRLPVPQRSRR